MFAAISTAAHAQQVCNPVEGHYAAGGDPEHGQPVFAGLTASEDLMEVRSVGDGTWTIVLTLKDGSSCSIVSGDGLENVDRSNDSQIEPNK